MDKLTIAEEAYKNGYEKGLKDAVKHGRWISSWFGFDCCSECRMVYTDGYFTAMGIKPRAQFNYCPNCGAKMDGGAEDG